MEALGLIEKYIYESIGPLQNNARFQGVAPILRSVTVDYLSQDTTTNLLLPKASTVDQVQVNGGDNSIHATEVASLAASLLKLAEDAPQTNPADLLYLETLHDIAKDCLQAPFTSTPNCITLSLYRQSGWVPDTTWQSILDEEFKKFDFDKYRLWPDKVSKLASERKFGNIARLIVEEGYVLAGRRESAQWREMLKSVNAWLQKGMQGPPNWDDTGSRRSQYVTLKWPMVEVVKQQPLITSITVINAHFENASDDRQGPERWPTDYSSIVSEVMSSALLSTSLRQGFSEVTQNDEKGNTKSNAHGGPSVIRRDLMVRMLIAIADLDKSTAAEKRRDYFVRAPDERLSLLGLSDEEILQKMNEYIGQISDSWKFKDFRQLNDYLKVIFRKDGSWNDRALKKVYEKIITFRSSPEEGKVKQKDWGALKSIWEPPSKTGQG